MSLIRGLSNDTVLSVTSTAKSIQNRLYDSPGSSIFNSSPQKQYMVTISQTRYTALLAAATGIFSLKCSTPGSIAINKITVVVGFDGTLANSTQIFNWRRFKQGTPTGGLSGFFPHHAINKFPNRLQPIVSDVRWADLTSTSGGVLSTQLTFESNFARFIFSRRLRALAKFTWNYCDTLADRLILRNGEGIFLHQTNVAVVGDNISLAVEFEEIEF